MALNQQYPWIIRVYSLAVCLLLTVVGWGNIGRSQALPVELNKAPKSCFPNRAILPEPPLSQSELSVPSLWLAQQRYGGEILEKWFIEEKRTHVVPGIYVDQIVTLVVNRYFWNQKRYLEQFIFVDNFAKTTRNYGYNLRVCNDLGNLVGYYLCDFQVTPLNCQMYLFSNGFRIQDFRVFQD